MLKFLLVLISLIQAFNAEVTPAEKKLDELYYENIRFGDTSQPYSENPGVITSTCDNYENTAKQTIQEYKAQVKGILKTLVDEVFADDDIKKYCQMVVKGGGYDKVRKNVVAINTHVMELKRLQDSLTAAMTQAAKDGKTTFPVLMCQLKLYGKKIDEIFKNDETSVREAIRIVSEKLVNKIVKVLEKEKGKPSEHCELPEATHSQPQYKSILLQIFKAIEKLDK